MAIDPIDIICILVGFSLTCVSTLFSAVLSSLSSARLEELEKSNALLAEELFNAKQFRSRAEHSLIFIDFVGILLASLFLGHTTFRIDGSWIGSFYGVLILIVGFLFIKAFLQGIGDRYANVLAEITATLLGIIIPMTNPFVSFLQWTTKLLSSEQTDEEARTEMEDEITAIMDEAVEDGTLDADEYRILTNIMQFSEVWVNDVMTPRNVIFSVSVSVTIEDVIALPELQIYSRFPVYDGESIDNVTGYVLTKDVLRAALNGNRNETLLSLVREIYFIPEHVMLDKALEEFLQRRQHMFIVVDEYGGVEGLITMEDVMETILGAEIVDEVDKIVDLRHLAKLRRDKRIAANIIVRDENTDMKDRRDTTTFDESSV